MDVFALRKKVVSDYRHYIESFVRINDEKIADFVEAKFNEGVLWPNSILQLNPAYDPGSTLDELAAQGGILKSTADFFRGQGGKPLRLYRHQQQAIETARRWESYVVTTGTGSGKVEDTEDRIFWFRQRMPQAVFARNAGSALNALSQHQFKVAFLDHDLHWMHADNSIFKGTGKEVARFMAHQGFKGIVIIHSRHEEGAAIMKKFLPNARLAPFGTFEIAS